MLGRKEHKVWQSVSLSWKSGMFTNDSNVTACIIEFLLGLESIGCSCEPIGDKLICVYG